MARLGVHSKLERQTLAALSSCASSRHRPAPQNSEASAFYCICLLLRGRAFSITTLVWTPLDLQVMAKAVKQGGPMTCGWHKPRLRGRISTQACLVRRFTLSQEFNRNTSLSCCISLWDQRKLHHLCGPVGVRSSPMTCNCSGRVSASLAVLAASALQCQWRTARMSHTRRVVP